VAAADAPMSLQAKSGVASVATGSNVEPAETPAPPAKTGMSNGQKVLCVVLVVASWVVASRLFEIMR
jgi:hypothetical protein